MLSDEELRLELHKALTKIEELEIEVMKWKGFACSNSPIGKNLKIKPDPYSPIGIKFEPVIE